MTNNTIGIDETEIINISIIGVDTKILFREYYKEIKNTVKDIGSLKYTLENGNIMPSIKIIDGLFFDELIIKTVYIPDKIRHSGYKHLYTCMKVGAGNILPDNRNNISIVKYREYVTQILPWYLKERYGIIADFSHVKIQSMEININIPITGTFNEYNRVLNLIIHILKMRGTIHDERKSGELPRTYWKRNNLEELILYDKKYEIESRYSTHKFQKAKEKWELKKQILSHFPYKTEFFCEQLESSCHRYIRMELRLYNLGKNKKRHSSQKKIEKFLNINDTLLDHITDDLIIKNFKEYLKQKILIPFCKWYYDDKKKIRKLVKEYKHDYGQSWQQYFYPALYKIEVSTGVLCIIDFAHLRDCLNFDSKKDGINLKHNLSAILQRFRKKEAMNTECDRFEKNDSIKIIEIFQALGLDYENEFKKYDINILPK